MNKAFLLVIVVSFGVVTFTSQQILANIIDDSGFHRTAISQPDSTNNTLTTHIVTYKRSISSELSLLVVAQDTNKPNFISFIISVKDTTSIDRVALIDSAGIAIHFFNPKLSRYQHLIKENHKFIETELSWHKFEEICKLDSIRLETGYAQIYLKQNIMDDINILREYFTDRDPNEPPSDHPTDDNVSPTIVKKVDPNYPVTALKAGLEGDVLLKVRIEKRGNVREVILLKSNAEIFNDPAIEAVGYWEFTPAKALGNPISVWVTIPIRFRLH